MVCIDCQIHLMADIGIFEILITTRGREREEEDRK
jgi:hypothetical protein